MVFSTEVEDPVYGRYWRMVKAGLPDGAVNLAMKRDGVDPKGFKGFNSHAHANGAFYDALPPPPNLAVKPKKPLPPLPPRPHRKRDTPPGSKDKPKFPDPSGINGSKDKPKLPKPSGINGSKDKPKLPKPSGINGSKDKPKPSGTNGNDDKPKLPKPSGINGSKDKPKLPKPSGMKDTTTPLKSPRSKDKPEVSKSPGNKDKPKFPPRKNDKKKSPGRAARDRKVPKRNNDNEILRQRLKKLESENAALKKKLSIKDTPAINADAKKNPSKLERKKSVNDLKKKFDLKADTPTKKRHSHKSKNSKNSVNDLKNKFDAKGETPTGPNKKMSVNDLKKIDSKADKKRSKTSNVSRSRSEKPNTDRKKSPNVIKRKSNNRNSNQKDASNIVKGTPTHKKDWKKDITKAKKAVNNIANKFEKGITAETPAKKTKAPKPSALNANKLAFQAKNKDNKESKNKRLTGMHKKGGFGNMNKFRDKLERETGAVASFRPNPEPQRRNSYGNGSFNPAPSFGGGYNRGNFDVPPSYGGGFDGPGSFGGGFGAPPSGAPLFGGGFNQVGEEWTECFSEEYQTPYYFNEITGESTWERPW